MRRSSFVIVVAALFATGGVAIYEAREVARGRASLTAEQKRMARLEHQLAELRQQRDEALHELELATQSLASASADAASAGAGADPSRAAAVNSWLARLKRLKQAFDEHPDQRIPELALLTDLDWLALARQLKLDSEDDLRKARAKTREVAFNKFQTSLGQAWRNYATAANGAPLSDVSLLMPYFKPPVDAAILQRYEIAGTFTPGSRSDQMRITERAPVDGEFDIRHAVSLDGIGGGSSPWVIDSLRQVTLDAHSEYAAANNGQRPKGEADILRYVHDPTAKMIFEAIQAYANDHHGQQPGNLTMLRPYLKDPAARALLEKLDAARQNQFSP